MFRAGIRELIPKGLYYSGMLSMLRRFSKSYENSSSSGRKLLPWRRVTQAKYVILCYHRISEGGFPFISSVTPKAFDAQMRFLRANYRIVSLDELGAEMGKKNAKGQSVAVTFDDGYRDLYTHAFSILKNYHVPATIFLTVNSIETGQVAWYDRVFLATHVFPGNILEFESDTLRRFDLSSPELRRQAAIGIIKSLRQLPDEQRRQCCAVLESKVDLPAAELAERMLTWDQVREMQKAGIRFGSHTLTHPVISRLSATEVAKEMVGSKRILEERLGASVRHFAYPFGQPADCGSDAEGTLRDAGYRSAATTSWGVNTTGGSEYRLLRVQIGEDSSLPMFAFQLHRLFAESTTDQAANEQPGSTAEKTIVSDSNRLASRV